MPKKPAKILLVEPDPAVREVLLRWLNTSEWEVRGAADGFEALRAFDSFYPQVIVAAWRTPGWNVAEFRTSLRRRRNRYVYLIVTAADGDQTAAVAALNEGADDLLVLSPEPRELLARIEVGLRRLRQQRRWRRLAKIDPLTGLASRRTFLSQLQREWSRARRHRIPLSCVMIDIDFFKRINDSLGHRAGDQTLRVVARILAENCRAGDLVGRYGGEEFVVLLPETNEGQAIQWANRVRGRLAECGAQARGTELPLTASFGVAEQLTNMRSSAELVEMADQALLVAKRSGRDRVVGFQKLAASWRYQDHATANDHWFHGLVAKDLMTPLLVEFREDETLDRVTRCFLQFRLHAAPVLDREGALSGIVSERDIIAFLTSDHWSERRLSDVMQRNVVCYDEQAPVAAIHEFLSRVLIRAVVITKDDHPVGMISRGSLFRWFANLAATTPASDDRDAQGEFRPRDGDGSELRSVADQLAVRAAELAERIRAGQDDDLLPIIVAAASNIEERLDDLLAALQRQRAARTAISPREQP